MKGFRDKRNTLFISKKLKFLLCKMEIAKKAYTEPFFMLLQPFCKSELLPK